MTIPRNSARRYALLLLLLCGLSLMFSPPNLRTERAVGVSEAEGVAPVRTTDQLTIKLGQNIGQAGEIGLAVKDLKTGETFNLGETRSFDAASTMKLLFAGYLYHQASNDELDLNEELTIAAGQVQRYGTGTIQHEPGPHRYSYRELTQLMLEKSDNTAAYVLAQNLGHENLQGYAESIGMSGTVIEGNTTTPADMLKLLEALHGNQLANPELSADLISLLDDSDFEDRLPARLPPGTKTYHKTGDNGGGLHDVGIITFGDRTYAVAMFTQGLGEKEKVVAQMADASRDIFAYETRTR